MCRYIILWGKTDSDCMLLMTKVPVTLWKCLGPCVDTMVYFNGCVEVFVCCCVFHAGMILLCYLSEVDITIALFPHITTSGWTSQFTFRRCLISIMFQVK